jgi:hypothetical protein
MGRSNFHSPRAGVFFARCAVKLAILALGAFAFSLPGEAAERKIARYEIKHDGSEALREAARRYSVEGRRGDRLEIYVPHSERRRFLRLIPNARLLEEDVDATVRRRALEIAAKRKETSAAPSAERYLELSEYQDLFAQYEKDHPEQVAIIDLDWMVTDDGKKIQILKVSNNVHEDDGKKPVVVFTGSTHGDEWISTAVPMGILDRLLAGYGKDDRLTRIVDRSVTYWLPSASPDSYHKTREVHGVDPNRVYPYPGYDQEPSILSARNFMRWYEEIKPQGTIDYHGIQGSILWPWGYTEDYITNKVDFDRYDTIAGAMAKSSGYIHGPTATTIYLAAGVTLDAWYYLHNTLSMTIEIGANSKIPDESEISKHVDANEDALYQYVEYFIDAVGTDDDDDSSSDTTEDTQESSETGTSEDGESSETSSGESVSDETSNASTSDTEGDDDDDDDDDDEESDGESDSTTSSNDDPEEDDGQGDEDSSASDQNGDGKGCAVTHSDLGTLFGLLGIAGALWRSRQRKALVRDAC